MYYRKSRYNFFRNIFTNKMTKYYCGIILVFILLSGFVYKSMLTDKTNSSSDDYKSTENVSISASLEKIDDSQIVTSSQKAYDIRINAGNNHIYVYDEGQLIKCFLCSVPIGLSKDSSTDLKINDKSVWRLNKNNVYSQYASILSNNLVIASIPFENANKDKMLVNYYENLGNFTSDSNIIYMMTGSANWIYNNCNRQSSISIYNDPSESVPDFCEEKLNILWCIHSDPTDDYSKSPWSDTRVKAFTGIRNQTIYVGDSFNPLNGVKAWDENDEEITSKIVISGEVNPNIPGDYEISYVVVDKYNGNLVWDAIISVIE